tara:strand:- start:99 stop:620 length:522 start_codon:yes stop_codon:yes gene_type:complete
MIGMLIVLSALTSTLPAQINAANLTPKDKTEQVITGITSKIFGFWKKTSMKDVLMKNAQTNRHGNMSYVKKTGKDEKNFYYEVYANGISKTRSMAKKKAILSSRNAAVKFTISELSGENNLTRNIAITYNTTTRGSKILEMQELKNNDLYETIVKMQITINKADLQYQIEKLK